VAKVPKFAEQLREGCQRRGIHLDDGVAELIVAEHINAVADRLRVTDHHAMPTYVTDDTIEQIIARCEQARDQEQAEVDLASLPIAHAATSSAPSPPPASRHHRRAPNRNHHRRHRGHLGDPSHRRGRRPRW
jgi:hypothetical protein